MSVSRQIEAGEFELQEACVFVVSKMSEVAGVTRLNIGDDVRDLIRQFVIPKFLTSLKGIESSQLIDDSSAKQLAASGSFQIGDLCEKGYEISSKYHETLRSRSALVIIAKFTHKGKQFVGFFQLREAAVLALFPERQELKVIQNAFRRFEKAFVIPSPAHGYDISIYQRSKAEYFERFVGIKRPPTPEEALEELIKSRNITTLSKLLELSKEVPAAKQARVKVELAETKATMRLDEIVKSLAQTGSSFVLLREGVETWVRIRQSKLKADPESVVALRRLLEEKGLL